MRHEFFDDNGLHRCRCVLPIDVHPFDKSINENHTTRQSFACFDGSVKVSCDFRYPSKSTTRSIQLIDNRESALLFAIICCWRVDMVTDFALRGSAIKGMKRHMRRLHFRRHPREPGLQNDSLRRVAVPWRTQPIARQLLKLVFELGFHGLEAFGTQRCSSKTSNEGRDLL